MFQNRAVAEEVAQLVRAEGAGCRDDRAVWDQVTQGVIAEAVRCQRLDLIGLGIDAHLAEVRRGSADRIGGHDMVDHGVAAFRNAVAEADRAVGVEGLALDVEMVRGDLGEGAAEGVACDGDLGGRSAAQAGLKCGAFNCPLRQCDRVRCLDIGACNHHSAIGQNRVAGDLLGATMGNDDLFGVYALIDGALIAVETIVDMLKYLVLMAV